PHGLGIEGTADVRPLVTLLRSAGVRLSDVQVSHPRLTFNRIPDKALVFDLEEEPVVTYYISEDAFPEVRVAFGYEPADLLRLVPLARLPPVPLLLPLWQRRAARRQEDPAVAWLATYRFQDRLSLLTWGAWVVAVVLLDAAGVAGCALRGA